jgi:7-cyano-7-deazaguanine reductase
MNLEVNQEAEGKKFPFSRIEAIATDELKTFLFDSPNQLIETSTPEFSAVCPFSGLPDIATLQIEYHPRGGKCIELKSLKYYITSFRNVGLYQEGVTKRIYEDLKKVLNTNSISVRTVYNVRGGFETTCSEGVLQY